MKKYMVFVAFFSCSVVYAELVQTDIAVYISGKKKGNFGSIKLDSKKSVKDLVAEIEQSLINNQLISGTASKKKGDLVVQAIETLGADPIDINSTTMEIYKDPVLQQKEVGNLLPRVKQKPKKESFWKRLTKSYDAKPEEFSDLEARVYLEPVQ